MSYTTLEAHIDHGKVLVKEPEKLPDSARALLTILESSIHESNGMSPMEALETLQKHLNRGLRFFGAFCNNSLIAVNGVHCSYAHLDYINRPSVALPRGFVYLNCGLTVPAYRNLGIGTVLRGYMFKQIQNEGYRSAFGAIFAENKGALRWNLRHGFKRWGRISFVKWCGRDFWWVRLTNIGRRTFPQLLDGQTNKPVEELILKAV